MSIFETNTLLQVIMEMVDGSQLIIEPFVNLPLQVVVGSV